MLSITRVETGIYIAEYAGRQVGSIFADQPSGGIAQGSTRHYTASFKVNPESEGFHHCGTLASCKRWLNDFSSLL